MFNASENVSIAQNHSHILQKCFILKLNPVIASFNFYYKQLKKKTLQIKIVPGIRDEKLQEIIKQCLQNSQS